MLKLALSSLKLWAKKNLVSRRFLVLFIPCDSLKRGDAVTALYARVSTLLEGKHAAAILQVSYSSFRSFLLSLQIKVIPARIVLFAHPTPRVNAFAANGLEGKVAPLGPDWWQESESYECVVAHVCRGAIILNQPPYEQIFPNWVSYRGDIRMYLGSPIAHERWARITEGIINTVWESRSATDAEARIRSVYFDAIGKIRDSYNTQHGDLLTVGYLQECLDLLEYRDTMLNQ